MQAVGSSSLRRESLAALGALGALTAGAGAVGRPNAQVPGPVWPVLYTLQALSGWRVWNAPGGLSRSRALQLWAAQLGLNTAWSWLSSRHRSRAALVDQLALGVSLAAYLRAAHKVDPAAAWLVAPCLAWVGLLTLLSSW